MSDESDNAQVENLLSSPWLSPDRTIDVNRYLELISKRGLFWYIIDI
jgi:hypothetical protein